MNHHLSVTKKNTIKIAIVGNSNSLLKDGWTLAFKKARPLDTIINLSVGASPSTLGLFRVANDLMKFSPIDIVILDFCVIDSSYIASGCLNYSSYLVYVQHLLASFYGTGSIPVVMILPRKSNIATESIPRKIYCDIAEKLNIPVFDAHIILEILKGNDEQLQFDNFFKDEGHYTSEVAQVIGSIMAKFISLVVRKRKGRFDNSIPDYIYPFKVINADAFVDKEKIIERATSLGKFQFFRVSFNERFSIKIGAGQCVHAIYGNSATGGVICFDNGINKVVKNMYCWLSRHAPDVNPIVILKPLLKPIEDYGNGISLSAVSIDTKVTEPTGDEIPPNNKNHGDFEISSFLIGPTLKNLKINIPPLLKTPPQQILQPNLWDINLICVAARLAIISLSAKKVRITTISAVKDYQLADFLRDLAEEALNVGDIILAENAARAAVDASPSGPYIRFVLAKILEAQHRYHEAIIEIDVALINPIGWDIQLQDAKTRILKKVNNENSQ